MTPSLPSIPNLEQLKHQSKDLVKHFKARNPEVMQRVLEYLPRASASALTLAGAQFVLARELGFASWPRLKEHIEALRPDPAAALEAFKSAVRDGEGAKLKTLLENHPQLREQLAAPLFSFDSPAVVYAAGRLDRKVLDVLLEYGADINARSQWWAGGFGVLPNKDPEFAAYLVERGAVVDIWAAAAMDRLDRLEELIREDPSRVNARGGDGQGPLHFAASIDVARFLLDHGAEIDMRDLDHGSTPAQYSVTERPDVCRYLVSRGAEVDLFMAVQLGDLELVRTVVAADPESLHARVGVGKLTAGTSGGGHIYLYTLQNGRSPLYLAAELGRQEIYRFLLSHSSPVEKFLSGCLAADETTIREVLAEQPGIVASLPPEQMRLIADAAWAHKTEAVRLMLKLGFAVDARGDEESTALNRAAVRGFTDLIDLLLEHGASMELKNAYGGKPLGACIWGAENFRDPKGDYVASVERLLVAGPALGDVRYPCANKRVNAVLRRYLDVLAVANIIAAIKVENGAAVAKILERDATLANRPTAGLLPLYQAIESDQLQIVKLLLEKGADPLLPQEPGGPTALAAAVKAGRKAIAEYLTSKI